MTSTNQSEKTVNIMPAKRLAAVTFLEGTPGVTCWVAIRDEGDKIIAATPFLGRLEIEAA